MANLVKLVVCIAGMKLLHVLFTTIIVLQPFAAMALAILIPLIIWNGIENRDQWGRWHTPEFWDGG